MTPPERRRAFAEEMQAAGLDWQLIICRPARRGLLPARVDRARDFYVLAGRRIPETVSSPKPQATDGRCFGDAALASELARVANGGSGWEAVLADPAPPASRLG
jgi:hypothetical protein